MSLQDIADVLRYSKAQGIDRLVLITLSNYTDENHLCYPSVKTLARNAGVSDRTIQHSIKRLIETEELLLEKPGGTLNGKRLANTYRVSQIHPTGVTDSPTPVSEIHPNQSLITNHITPPIVPQGDDEVSKNGKAKKEKLTVELILTRVLSDLTLTSLDFLEAWTLWVRNRLELPKPTLGAFEEHMRICERLGQSRAIAAIHHSIANNWLSIFEPRQATSQKMRRESAL